MDRERLLKKWQEKEDDDLFAFIWQAGGKQALQARCENLAGGILAGVGLYEDREDVAQEVAKYLHEKRQSINDATHLEALAIGKARYLAFDLVRAQRLEQAAIQESSQLQRTPGDLEQQLQDREMRKVALECFLMLTEDHRVVLELYYVRGLSYKHIAFAMQKSVPQVRDLLYRARRRLAALIAAKVA